MKPFDKHYGDIRDRKYKKEILAYLASTYPILIWLILALVGFRIMGMIKK